MKPYFQRCVLCGAEVAISELHHDSPTEIVCRDVLTCDRRARGNDQAHLTALQLELKRVNERRSELIEAIGDWYKRTGTPDPVLARHTAEMKRIEADAEC